MRHPRDIPGGVAARVRWAVGGPFRVVKRAMAPARAALGHRRERSAAHRRTAADERRWDRLIRGALRRPAPVETLFGEVSPTALPVIVCLWNRPQRIDDVLALLDRQEVDAPLRLMLWNNAPEHDEHYRARMTSFAQGSPAGGLGSIEYVSSERNLGGFARFLLARYARVGGSRSPVFVMLDDDQDVSPRFIADLLRAGGPKTYAGVWAWRYLADSHWDREPANPGEEADYVGTGGSICDLAVVDDRAFFTALPARFAFLEDQWLSAYARSRGWHLRKVETPVEFVLHESNQFHGMAELKNEFRRYLAAGPAPRPPER
jgi:hypothetical protein